MKIKKVDTRQWQPYDLNKLFHIVLPKGDIQEKRIDDGDIPLISAGKINNGIVKYVNKNGDGISTIIDGNCITIDMFGKAFYQEKQFYAVSHGRVNILVPKFELNKNIALFLCSVLDSCGNKYNFKEMCNKARLEKLKITIPVDENDEPDFEKMEDYMIKTENEVKENKKKLDAIIAVGGHKIDTSTWKEFVVGDIFDCQTTQAMISPKDGNYNYVSRSAFNNGVSRYVDLQDRNGENFELNKGNCITIGAEGRIAFYQKDDFIAGVKVYAIRHTKLNEKIALFLCSLLNVNATKYKYTEARILDKIKQETIPLPTTPNNQPDWKFMEDYIKSLPYGDKI